MAQKSFAFGQICLEITCADTCRLINYLIEKSIYLQEITYLNDITIQIIINDNNYDEILDIAVKQGASVKIIRKTGLRWKLKAIRKRPVIILGCLFMLIFACFLQSRTLFFRVSGNQMISDREILEAAQECGIRFGVSRRKIRSENMKNALLQKIPQLKWAGINTAGCTAVISVREKTEPEEENDPTKQVSSIIALRDGIIQNCTVYQGNSLCSVGQAVKAGQTLVSGYTDCGIVTTATQARAEIRALTYRQLELLTPQPDAIRGECTGKKTKYSLRIGKNVINFMKDSGNSTDLCGKIYLEECWQLPGGFTLPVAIIKETSYHYDQGAQETASNGADWLAGYAESYLQDIMIAGEVISSQTKIVPRDSGYQMNGKYTCLEMIGQVKVEQTIVGEDTND